MDVSSAGLSSNSAAISIAADIPLTSAKSAVQRLNGPIMRHATKFGKKKGVRTALLTLFARQIRR
ncbi:MAG: hypothetical protein KDB01_16910 [Planctomycetaceae bacterium]|nr:hypothetical protein [Planctomycetaceae bacterium]